MKLEGSHSFSGSQQEIWDFIMDPEVIGKTIPGCEDMKSTGDDVYEAKMTIGISSVKGVYNAKVRLLDKQPPESYRLKIEGKGVRGFLNGTVSVRLEGQGQNTVMHYTAENQIGGPIAAVGQRIVGAAAKMFVKQSFKSLEKQLAQRREKR